MVKVLIVEDSLVVREFLEYVLGSDPGIQVIGTATNGEESLRFLSGQKPDVITMDINMPKMNGFEATRRIMETVPTPIVIVSGSWNTDEVATTFKAVEAGALAVVARPNGIGHPEHEKTARDLVETVKLMSEVKVVRRWPRYRQQLAPSRPTLIKAGLPTVRVVAIGTSTGGPVVLQIILSALPKDFPVPVLIVQHISPSFTLGLVEWLARSSGLPVHLATDGEYTLPGHVYVAPDGAHLGIAAGGRLALSTEEPEHGLRPSVSHLFRSVTAVYGRNAAGILLTGMGKDGAQELRAMRDAGALTIVQDEESSVVYGMPGEAVRLDAARYVLTPESIATALESLVRNNEQEL